MWEDQKDLSSARTEPAGHVEIGAGPCLTSPSPSGHSASSEQGAVLTDSEDSRRLATIMNQENYHRPGEPLGCSKAS